MAEYWVKRDGKRLGPFDEPRILNDLDKGLLRPDDALWVEGLESWVPVREVVDALRGGSGGGPALELEPMDSPIESGAEAESVSEPVPFADAGEHGPREFRPAAQDFTFRYAGFWVRFAAVLIDEIPILLLTVAFGFGLAFLIGSFGTDLRATDSRVDALSLIISWLYYATLEGGRHSATLGKRVFNLQVLRADDLQPFGFGRGTARFCASILSALLLLIGYLMQPFTARKQALHDMITDTVVIVRAPYSRTLLGVVIALWLLLVIGGVGLLIMMLGMSQSG